MPYTKDEVAQYIRDEDVKFIRLAFCDIFGTLKNIAIIPDELERAFDKGVCFDGSSVKGFARGDDSDLLLFPVSSTLTVLPWRSVSGKVVRLFCDIKRGDDAPFERDSRGILKAACAAAEKEGVSVKFGTKCSFYLFQTDEKGRATRVPQDTAGYLDVAPEDKGENIRREICLTLRQMDIHSDASFHVHGPGQNEIDIREAAALAAADSYVNFISVVKAIAVRNGLCADFSPLPIADANENALYISVFPASGGSADIRSAFMAGVLSHVREIAFFLNPSDASYRKSKRIDWGMGNRNALIRVPASASEPCFELRSADPILNPYLALALIIYAGLDGVRRGLTPGKPRSDAASSFPRDLKEAYDAARGSAFVASCLPEGFVSLFEN